ncbi:flagellar cap protein FliD N-terminal domain-containing protein [Sporosarcina thermotolerans]|uniref:flagellar cap protein FliD N-terminal domain-containing protein n=1 Tax=Sporosarcina thermotolerans TaxID=633404 RepID=UPI0024BD123D|nr:flagellar cap protein FliD N-terminal domain-containing protein [Sporosarcina thermotolerans]WHT47915.1 flagellar cap protein FliD N-terminal domain-containing protein [Sporosarcina thermotolerans]
MRISGLATGMDTEQIIRDMMKAHRIPLEKITQKKQYTEWQMDDYRSVNRNITDLKYKVTDTMGRQSTFMQKTVNISNPNAVGIKGLSAISEFAGTIKVDKLATQASLQGGMLTNVKGSTRLEQLEGYDGEKIIKVRAIDKNGELGEVKELKFSATDTIDSVIKKINSETGVNAFFDEYTGKIAMTAKNSGALKGDVGTPSIVIEGKLGDVLKLTGTHDPDDDNSPKFTAGNNAEFIFNGLKTQRASNTFTINGFEVNLKQVTTDEVTFSSAGYR